jgi:hypothetical protein
VIPSRVRAARRRFAPVFGAGLALHLLALQPAAITLQAQGNAAAPGQPPATVVPPLTLRGTVVRQTAAGERRLAREQVTLHRVNARDAGAVDSMLTDGSGAFVFRVTAPDSQSMYLVSARYGGIAYFSPPAQPGQPVPPAEIVVYDTTSADVPLALQGRHLVLSAPNADGVRSVIDVLEVQNDSVVTRVAGVANRPTFTLLLPDGARNVRASQGEQGSGAVEVRQGRADLFAPIAPGLRQVVLTYELAADAFPVSVPLERAIAVLEVLLEEPGASAEGGGLVSQGGVTVDGKAFTRYLGQNAPANAVLTLRGAGRGVAGTPPWLLPLVLTVLALGSILVMARRGSPARAGGASTAPQDGRPERDERAERLAGAGRTGATTVAEAPQPDDSLSSTARELTQRIAAIDALLASGGAHPASRASLAEHRAVLKQALRDALADRTPVP